MQHIAKICFAVVALAVSGSAAAEGWESGAHVGYGVMQRSSTGFKNVGGSLSYFDVARRFTPEVAAGLRTMMQGARGNDAEFYRLGVGPYASYRVTETVAVELAVSRFSESGLNADGDRTYRSSGTMTTLGWDRRTYSQARFDLSWGGFIGWHSGRLDTVAAATSEKNKRFQAGAANLGLTRGLALSLTFRP